MEDIFKNIFDYVDRVVNIVRPRKVLFLAIGTLSSINASAHQQRTP